MTIDLEPLYDLEDKLLGHSVHLILSTIDFETFEMVAHNLAHPTSPRYRITPEMRDDFDTYHGWARLYGKNGRGLECEYVPRDRQHHERWFQPL